MQKIGFIGGYDKLDLILYIAKILTVAGKKILIIDCTHKQKARYVVPSITPTPSYVTEFENIDVAVGFGNQEQLLQYLGTQDLKQKYDMIFVDTDMPVMFERFGLSSADINYFVTSFDVYDLKRGLDAIKHLKEPVKMTKILFSKNMSSEEEQYLDFLAKDYKVTWNDYKIYFPVNMDDWSAIIENQRVEKIKFKKLTSAYKANLLFITEEISKDIRETELRRIIKTIEKGV